MAFRSVVISNPAVVRSSAQQLVIEQDSAVSVPQDDITVLVLESREVLISSNALASLADTGVATVVCDAAHMPVGVCLPLSPHSRQLQMIRLQLGASVPLNKRLWQHIVVSKIQNQADALRWSGTSDVGMLIECAKATQSGDVTNREAVAARWYFARFRGGVNRRDGSVFNAALDYGYSIVRACIARSLVSHGFVTALGIHHCNEYNQFNLADDLLEPFRPTVDAFIAGMVGPRVHDLNQIKQRIPGVVHQRCSVNGRAMSVASAVESITASLVTSLRSKDASKLVIPGFLTPGAVDTTREGENASHENDGYVRSPNENQSRKARLYSVS